MTCISSNTHDSFIQIESGHEYNPKTLSTSVTKKEKTGTRRKEKENVVKFLENTATDIQVGPAILDLKQLEFQ